MRHIHILNDRLVVVIFAGVTLSVFVTPLLFHVGNASALSYDERLKFSLPKVKTQQVELLGPVSVGQQVTIETTMTHNLGDEWDLIAFIEVRNIDGVTEYLAWQSGKLGIGDQKTIGTLWIPDHDGVYQIRAFAITNNWEKPEVLTQVHQSEIMVRKELPSIQGSLLVLTDDGLLTLREGTLEYNRTLDTKYSEIAWDGKYLYLVEFQRPYTETMGNASKVLVLDQYLSEISYLEISQPIYDFIALNGTMYVLAENKLRLIDVEDHESSPDRKMRLEFSKSNHDIMHKDGRVYLLDNIAGPLYIHVVELPSLGVHTKEFTGVNAHLVAQDILGDKWYVLESVHVLDGYFENLFVFSSNPEKLSQDPEGYRVVIARNDAPPELIHYISHIHLLDEDTLFALGGSRSYEGQSDNKLTFMVYSLDGDAKQLASLDLGEHVDSERYPPTTNIVMIDGKVYVGGQSGIYMINVDDLERPVVAQVLPTDSPVQYLLPVG